MSLVFAETAGGTPAALRVDDRGRLDASWDYTPVTATGLVHTGPCVVVGVTPVNVMTLVEVSIRDGTGPGGQEVGQKDVPSAYNGEFIQMFPSGGARLQNGLYVELGGSGSLLIWWRRA